MATSSVDFRIGPRTPTRYASFTNSSPTWGSSIAQMGNAWAKSHAKRKTAEADRQLKTEQAVKRAGWSKQIGEGASVRDISMRDPSIMGDASFLAFLDKTKPEAAPETFEIADDPYGRGGIGQRSSTTGKISGYQGPRAPEGPPATMTDAAGFHRYIGGDMHGQRVFPEVQKPADEPKIAPAILAYEQAKARGHIEPNVSFADYKNMGRTQNMFQMRTAAPAPERGYKNIFDDAGNFTSQELIPGSPAALKIEADRAKAEEKTRAAGQRSSIVSEHATGIRKLMEDSTFPVTGLFSATQNIPGTAAHDIAKRVDTLKAIAGFEQLNQMRAQSPTGGALGQVSERELTFLQSVIGSLELSQSKGQFLENLARVESTFNEIVHGGRTPPPEVAGNRGAPVQAPRGAPQAADSPGFAALAKALTGSRTPAPTRAPAHAAAGMAPAPASSLPAQRVRDYFTLKPDALRRQADQMAEELAVNPEAYSQEEIDAAKIAYDRAFPGR